MKARGAHFIQSAWAFALIVAALGFVTFTRANGFPWQYHADEKTKTSQVLEGTRNLRHPLLLLNTADVATRLIPVKLDEQVVTRIGRYVSAIFALGAVVALALFARKVEGPLCGWCVGLVAILNPQLVELAHYFKEDTALLLGWALTALSLWLCVERRTAARAAALGVALAVAGSAKYLGFLSLPIAIAVVGWAGRKDAARARWKFASIAAAVFVALLLMINFQLLLNLGQFERSMDYEMYHVVNGQRGVAGDSSVMRYLTSLPAVFGWPVLIASLVGSLACIHPARRRYWLLAVFPWLYILALSTSPKLAFRYLLPATGAACWLAGLGVVALSDVCRRWKPIAAGLLGVALIAGSWPQYRAVERAFTRDGRRELASWLIANAAPNASILYETKIGLGWLNIAELEHFTLLRKDVAADVGTLDELAAKGIHYVIVHGENRAAYAGARNAPSADIREQFEQRRKFYSDLASQAKVVWKQKSGEVANLLPDIRVYQITPLKPQP